MTDLRSISSAEVRSFLSNESFPVSDQSSLDIELNPSYRNRFVLRPSNFEPIALYLESGDYHPNVQRDASKLIEMYEGIEDPDVNGVREVSRLLTLLSEERDELTSFPGNKYSFEFKDFDRFQDYSRLHFFDGCIDVLEDPSNSNMERFPLEYKMIDPDMKERYWSDLHSDKSPHAKNGSFPHNVRKSTATDEDRLVNYFVRSNLISQGGKLKASDEEIDLARQALNYFIENRA